LALVKEIMEAHEGHVTVQSTMGKGSTFIVTLPIGSLDNISY
jgi:signal transduction histidine kinase